MRDRLWYCVSGGGFIVLAAILLAGCGPEWDGAKPRQGIITMGPHVTETVFALGQGHRVIAVGNFDDYPPEVRQLPKVGGYLDPDLEKIAMLAPERIITGGRHLKVAQFAEMNKFPLLSVHMDSLESIDEGIAQIGLDLHCVRAADRLRAKIQREIQELREAVAPFPRPKVLIITGRQAGELNTLNTVGGASFLSEIVAIAGGENIFKDASQAYFEASKETVVLRAPEVILEFRCGEPMTESRMDAYFKDWRTLPMLPAVRTGRIFFITESHGMRPGPRVAEVGWIIARLLHSDIKLPA